MRIACGQAPAHGPPTPIRPVTNNMSSPIIPSPRGPAAPRASRDRGPKAPADIAALAALEAASSIELTRGAPPPEVLEEIARAGRTHERLARSARELRFALGAQPGAVAVELLDGHSGQASALTVAQAFQIACEGQPGEGA